MDPVLLNVFFALFYCHAQVFLPENTVYQYACYEKESAVFSSTATLTEFYGNLNRAQKGSAVAVVFSTITIHENLTIDYGNSPLQQYVIGTDTNSWRALPVVLPPPFR